MPADVILARTLGGAVLVGTIAPYAGDDAYETEASLPVVLTVDASPSDDLLRGTVVNARAAVALSDGACAPALTAAGAANPLTGEAGASVQISRDPSMHVDFDDELVLIWGESFSGMGEGFYPSVATLMDADPLSPTWQVTPHGTPTSGPALVLQRSDARVDTGRACG